MVDVVGDAFENLVTQFSGELDFLRELVQNSIDAGSAIIEVWMEFHAEAVGEAGTIAVHVDDHGEGMDEAIIDGQFTTLFASTKEDDLTKIGKFGIGFVSVFAISPRAVLVHTGRAGEYWEVCFDADRSFTRSRIAGPVEGTQITVFVAGDAARYRDLVVDARATLRRWCRHSDTEISFEDRSTALGAGAAELINEPFGIEGPVRHLVRDDEVEIALAFHRSPRWSFFNKGLTLAELTDLDLVGWRFRHVAFKVKSKLLEHTLARETVIRDHNYDRALARVHEAANEGLRAALVEELVELAARERWSAAEHARYFERLFFLAHEDGFASFEGAPILRRAEGGAVALAALWDEIGADDRIYVSDAASALSGRLAAQGTSVLLGAGADGEPTATLLRRYLRHRLVERGLAARLRGWIAGANVERRIAAMVAAPEACFVAVSELQPEPRIGRLLDHTRALIEHAATRPRRSEIDRRQVTIGYRRLVPVRLEGPSSASSLFLTGRELAPLMALPPPGAAPTFDRRRPVCAINVEHPQLEALASLDEIDPGLAAYALARSLTLVEDRLLFEEFDLLVAARELWAP